MVASALGASDSWPHIEADSHVADVLPVETVDDEEVLDQILPPSWVLVPAAEHRLVPEAQEAAVILPL